ncbi:hypothetical protein BGZ95_011540 [Linnemannia exigua]|uniref:C2H2-type domain-containing protein n=1 Tax=Linnemannia exigua TaxID=604196 RepID=A0AAD4H6C8_9FUNG|nr:hypothetical protein BGZ95_011540 [Linnemannia exigua]
MPISDRQRALSGERRLSQQDIYSNGHIVHTEWAGHHDSTMNPLHRESSAYYNDDHAEYQHSGVHHPYHTDNSMNYHLKGSHDGGHHSDLGDYTMHGSAYDGRYGSVGGVPRSEHLDGEMDMRLGNPMMDKQRNNSISSNASSNSSSSIANKHPCKFPTCGWSFKRYEHLKRHMLVHTKERPFVCEFQGCEKSFSRSDNFSAHLRTHTKKSMHMRKFDRHMMMDSNNNFMPLNNPNVGSGGMVANGMVCVVGGNDDGRGYPSEPSHYRHGINNYSEYHDSRHSPPLPPPQAIGAGHGSFDSASVVLPKFSPIKIDLKAVSNDPDDVHLHNQHNIKSESLNRHYHHHQSHHYDDGDDPLCSLHRYQKHRNRSQDDRYHEFGHHSSSQGPPLSSRYTSPGLRSLSPPPRPMLSSSSSMHRRYGSMDVSHQQQYPHHRMMLGSSHDIPNPNPNGESPTLPPRRLPSPSFRGGSTDFSAHFVPMEAGPESSQHDRNGILDRDRTCEEDEENEQGYEDESCDDEEEGDEDMDGDDDAEVAENALRAKKLQMMGSYHSSLNLTSQSHQQDHHSRHMIGSASPPPMMPTRSSSEGYVGSAVALDEDGNLIQGYGDGPYHRHSISGCSPDLSISSSAGGHRIPFMSPRLQSSSSQLLSDGNDSYDHRGSLQHPLSSPGYSLRYLNHGTRGSGMSSSSSGTPMGGQQPHHYNQQHHRMASGGGDGGGNTGSGASGSLTASGRVRGSSGPSKNHCCRVPGCMKRFKRLEHLKRHTKTHTLERPFACTTTGCNKRFSRSDNLSQHIKTHQRQLMSKSHWKHRSTMLMPGL